MTKEDFNKIKQICSNYKINVGDDGTILTKHETMINKHFEYNNNIKIDFEKYSKILDINSFTKQLNNFNKSEFLDIVNCVIKNITNREFSYFTDIYFLTKKDFDDIKIILVGNENMKFDGIRLVKQNIIITHDGMILESAFRLLFHEIAHSFYRPVDLFTDEYNAMLFEIRALDKLMELINNSQDKLRYNLDHENYLPEGTTHYKAMEKALKTYNEGLSK